MALTPISGAKRSAAVGRLFLGLFFGVFLAAGLGFLIPMFGIPALRMIEARSWTAVPCRILASSVHTSHGSDGNTYRVDVRYAYEVDERTLVGERYKFVPGSSSGYESKAAAVAGLPPGSTQTCWVNPSDASQVVLERGPTGDMFFALIPLVFVLVGGVGVFAAIAGGRTRGLAATLSAVPHGAQHVHAMLAAEQPYPAPSESRVRRVSRQVATVLQPAQSRRGRFIGLTFFALLWNGIVLSIMQPTRMLRSFDIDDVFLIPFVLVGAAVAVAAVREALRLANPVPRISLSTASPSLGDTMRVGWSIEGRAEALRSLHIDLVGHEEARYRRGTDTVTQVEVFATMPLVRAEAPIDPTGGHVEVVMPADAMHSFESANNKVVWSLNVRGEIPNWPDSDDSFPLAVAPRRI